VRTYTNDLVLLIQECLENPNASLSLDKTISDNVILERKKLAYNPQASPSPLTTDQLYTRAGWVENPSPVAPVSLTAVISKNNEGYATNNPQACSLFMSSHSSDEDSGAEDLQIASKIRDNILVPHKLNFDIAEKDDDEEELQEDDVQEEVKDSDTIIPDKPNVSPKKLTPSTSGDLMEIPQSMVEIYQLSNKNRKNKNKGKWRQKKEDKANEKKDVFDVADEIHFTKRERSNDDDKKEEEAKGMKKRKK